MDGLNVIGRTAKEGMAHFKRSVQKTEKCGLALQGISEKTPKVSNRLENLIFPWLFNDDVAFIFRQGIGASVVAETKGE